MSITSYELLERACRRHGDRVALRSATGELRYVDLRRRAFGLAAGLARGGVAPGARVVLLLRNCSEYVVADLALLHLGAIKVPLNEHLTAAEVAYVLDHSEAQAVIVNASLAPVLEDALVMSAVRPRLVAVDDGAARPPRWEAFDAVADGDAIAAPEVSADAPALLLYTGGTTGKPKGVLHTRAALGINLLTHVIAGEIRTGERMLLSTPLPHSAGFHLQACLLQGGTVTLLPRFDAEVVLETIARERISWTFMVPTMLHRLLEASSLDRVDTSSLETVVYGAAPISSERLRRAIERFGPVFLQLYGQVECPNYLTTLSKQDHLRPELQASCGQPVLSVELRIAGEDGAALPPGEVGEIVARAPYTLREYYRAPELTAAAFRDGWLRTGDLGYQLDSGHVFLVDRAKDMIITGGLNVYCSEVESVIEAHPAVASAAVIGVPHEDWGEAVHAVVARRSDVDADELLQFCRGRLATYKIPKAITFAGDLPLTPYGKIDKKKLRAPFWGGQARAIH